MAFIRSYHEDSEADREKLKEALSLEKQPDNDQMLYFDLKPFAYQQEILEQLEIDRSVHGFYRNLVVAATGTGKTMVAAFDYLRLNKEMPQSRLLFLAHREEILKQSCKTYRAVLKDANFGEYWVAGSTPSRYEHVFASIQTLNARSKFNELPRDHFDVIVLDETHHSASDSYQCILGHFEPRCYWD